MGSSARTILGIDPGTGRMGWAILTGSAVAQKLISVGCVETPAHTAQTKRLGLLYQKVTELIQEHQPIELAIEDLYFSKNTTTAIKVAEARGAIITAAIHQGLSVHNYNPMQIKQTITGYGKADKRQVQQMVKSILKLDHIPRPDDAADAVAVGLTHVFTNSALA